jgi:hypothetical protein
MAKYDFPLLGLSYTPMRNSLFLVHTKVVHKTLDEASGEEMYTEESSTFLVTGRDEEEVKLNCLFVPGIQGIQSFESMLIDLENYLKKEYKNGS